jgi:nucleotide-binding universal stress UspA family protein
METQINSILIPTDFSDLSKSALKVGIAIANRQNASITLLHVIDKFVYLSPPEVFFPDAHIPIEIILTIENKIKKLSETIQIASGIQITGKVLIGIPSDSISQLAFNENFSLIVMGTHGTSGLREFYIGSEAFRVIKNTKCPVLTIPGNWEKTYFKKVLFPIRLLSEAFDKYFFSRPIIEKNNSDLFILGLAEKEKPDELIEVSDFIDQIKHQLNNDNVIFQTELSSCENFPAKVFKMAEKHDVDLIIVTANLDQDYKAYFVGPFVQQIVNHSRYPVLSIRPG